MGRFIDGEWKRDRFDHDDDGRFVRPDTSFRCGGLGDDGSSPTVEDPTGRYRLYVSLACPWAHRTLIARKLLGLEDVLPVTVVHPVMGDEGWHFDETWPEPEYDLDRLGELYLKADPHYTGRVTVPVLWDRKAETIACNESSEILRLLNRDFRPWARTPVDLYPLELRREIDAVNERVYDTVNNGVYKAGFARSQAAYDEAIAPLFETLEWLDQRLADRQWLMGESFTEADIRLFTTAIRFDPIYNIHFKCSVKRLQDHDHLWRWTRDVLALEGVADTVDIEHAKTHYYKSHRGLNPSGIVPVGPALDYTPEPREHARSVA